MKYDFVIVGGGSTGCVLAARLSEDPSRNVLLLEAGPDYPDVASMPPALSSGTFSPAENPEYLWHYVGTGTPLHRQQYPVIRGRVLGGSGSVNGANFTRNLPEDFDSWGSELWAFEALLPFFRKLEADRDFGGDLHGTDGPIPVGRLPRDTWAPFHQVFYDNAIAVGHAEKQDLSNCEGSGVGPLPRNDSTGIRVNSAIGYLNPARTRPNLTVWTDALTVRIGIEGRRATYVEATVGGELKRIHAGEVVLCAGAIESPHLLMLSGLGPADNLRALGIPVIEDIPGVGQNLTDHGAVDARWAPTPRRGPAHTAGAQACGLVYTAAGSPYRNDMRLQPSAGYNAQSAGAVGGVQSDEKASVSLLLDRPTSFGHLELTSTDPTVVPNVDFRYLDTEFDIQRVCEAVRVCVEVVEHGDGGGVIAERLAPLDSDLATDATLRDWVLTNFRTAFHSCGTAKLGGSTDDQAVVDERCRVRGVDGLRVADLSIMPVVGRGTMNPTAVMIGERVAALLSE